MKYILVLISLFLSTQVFSHRVYGDGKQGGLAIAKEHLEYTEVYNPDGSITRIIKHHVQYTNGNLETRTTVINPKSLAENNQALKEAERDHQRRAEGAEKRIEESEDKIREARNREEELHRQLRDHDQQWQAAMDLLTRQKLEEEIRKKQSEIKKEQESITSNQQEKEKNRQAALLAQSTLVEQEISTLKVSSEDAALALDLALHAVSQARELLLEHNAFDFAQDLLDSVVAFKEMLQNQDFSNLKEHSTDLAKELTKIRTDLVKKYKVTFFQQLDSKEAVSRIELGQREVLVREFDYSSQMVEAASQYDFAEGFNQGIDLLSQIGLTTAKSILDFTVGFVKGAIAPFKDASAFISEVLKSPSHSLEKIVNATMQTISNPDRFVKTVMDAWFKLALRMGPENGPEEQGKAWGEFTANAIIGLASGGLNSYKVPSSILPAIGSVSESAIGREIGKRIATKIDGNPSLSSVAKVEPFFEESSVGTLTAPSRTQRYTAEEAHKLFHPGKAQPYLPGTYVKKFETTTKETRWVRVHKEDNQERFWIMRAHEIDGLSAAEIQKKYSLPYLPTKKSEVLVPPGNIILVSRVNGIFNGQTGAIQYELTDLTGITFKEVGDFK